MGGGQIVYVFPFFLGKRETHKQNSQDISGKGWESPGTVPGKSRDNPVKILFMRFLVYWFSLALIEAQKFYVPNLYGPFLLPTLSLSLTIYLSIFVLPFKGSLVSGVGGNSCGI